MLSLRRVAVGACCFNSGIGVIGVIYGGGRGLYHLYQRYVCQSEEGKAAINQELRKDWSVFKTAGLLLPPVVGIFLSALYGDWGISSGTSINHLRSIASISNSLDRLIFTSFFPLQLDNEPSVEQAKARRAEFIKSVNGEEVLLDPRRANKVPAVFINKSLTPDTIFPDDLCIIMAHGNGMQLEGMEEFVIAVRAMDREKNSVLVYTLDGYGPNRDNEVQTCEESAKFDSLSAVNYALERGYKRKQIVFFGFSIGTVGASVAAHLAKTHCIFYKGFTSGADVAYNVCSNFNNMMKLDQTRFSSLVEWAGKQLGQGSSVVIKGIEETVSSKKFKFHGSNEEVEVPLNGMNNLWHLQQMDPTRRLLCIGGSKDHLMGLKWDEVSKIYTSDFSHAIWEAFNRNKTQKNYYYMQMHEGHVDGSIYGDGCGIRNFLNNIRKENSDK